MIIGDHVTTLFFFSHTFTFQLLDKPWSQVGVVPPPPRFLPSIFIAHRVQQSHCSSIFHRLLLTHALELSASQFVHKKKSQRIYIRVNNMHSAGLELTKLAYTRLEDNNLIRHQGDRLAYSTATVFVSIVVVGSSDRPCCSSSLALALYQIPQQHQHTSDNDCWNMTNTDFLHPFDHTETEDRAYAGRIHAMPVPYLHAKEIEAFDGTSTS